MSDPIIDAIAVDSVVSEAGKARQGRRGSRFNREQSGECLNCGTPLKGQVCHSCGQDSDSFHRPIWSLFWEVFDGLLSIDGKLWRTLPKLLFRPGYLTRHYLEGVRARYVQPFRLLLGASVIFFFVFWSGFGGGDGLFGSGSLPDTDRAMEELTSTEEQLRESNPEAADDIARMRAALANSEGPSNADGELGAAELSAEERAVLREQRIAGMRHFLVPEDHAAPSGADGQETVTRIEDEGVVLPGVGRLELTGANELPLTARRVIANQLEVIIRDPSRWLDSIKANTTYLLVALLPVHALILAFGQLWRRGFYFYDHLIASLHFHAFIFVLLTLLNLLGGVLNEWGILIFILWSNFYVYRMHRVVYEHGRIMSVLRTISLDFTYAIVLFFALLALIIVGLFTA
jgi:hypothetical protein